MRVCRRSGKVEFNAAREAGIVKLLLLNRTEAFGVLGGS